MKFNKITLLILAFLCLYTTISAQNHTQTIRGIILDKDAKTPLTGATVAVTTSDPLIGTSSDVEGDFRLERVPIGRHNITITYLGYEPYFINNISLKSGKELVLNIELLESTERLNEVVVSASNQFDKTKALNEMAVVSARSFSVEETERYAAALYDPARMAQNYAGVMVGGAGNDLNNEIIIRGNSPASVLWRLEGVQIPNPNHYGSPGNSGGAISMLSSSTLANSDFYTGAFPAEFGNALSGVFDLNMRNGNNEKQEYAFMLGALGIEAAAEGPFSKNSKSSYLVNYRYSTLAALSAVGLSPVGDITPIYQDLSFKVHVPTKIGVFDLFGLAGKNIAFFEPQTDSTIWESSDDKFGFEENGLMATVGLSHRLLLNNDSWLRTVIVASLEDHEEEDYFLDEFQDYKEIKEYDDNVSNTQYRISSTYHQKLDARNTIQIGGILGYNRFNMYLDNYNKELGQLRRYFDSDGTNFLIQAFGHWKHRFNEDLTFNAGLHYTQMTLNNKFSIEPRAAVSWQINPKQTLSLAAGLHSRQDHLAVYLFEATTNDGRVINPKTNLALTKAFHGVLGYDFVFNANLRLKTELYYQHLYDVPIEINSARNRSILNAFDIWEVIGFSDTNNEGTGRNIGIDLTLEKFFSDQYYFLITASLYESKYKAADGKLYNTRFNGNYQLNALGGKEFRVGKNKKNTLAVNGKIVLSGGNRYTPIDFEASKAANEEVLFTNRYFEDRSGTYWRVDIGVNYKVNLENKTHSIGIDIQNVTNHQNIWEQYYSRESGELEYEYQNGFFPNFNYRLEF